jgi:hypothetical protein
MSSKCWREDHSGDFAPTLWTHKGIYKVGSFLETLKNQQILTSWLQIFFKAKCQSCGHPTHTQPWNPSAAISKTCLVCLSVRDMTIIRFNSPAEPARHVNIKIYLFSVSWRSDPLSTRSILQPLCVSVRLSGRICFFFFFFLGFFLSDFSPLLLN